MKRYACAAAAVLLVVFPWRQTSTAQQVIYTVESLGTFASVGSTLASPPAPETGINASGEVVGTVQDTLGRTRAVRYTNAVGWENVPGLTLGSTASAINANGDIVGYRAVGAFTHAYRYNANTGIVDDILPLTNGSNNWGFAINDKGDVVGQSEVGNGATRGFIARPGQPAVVLPTLGGTTDSACGINSSDQVAMTSTATGFPHAARVEADGVTIEDAGTVDGTPGESMVCQGTGAGAIDDLGHIGGFSQAANSTFHAFRWSPGRPVAVDATLPSLFGNVLSIANGMSAGWYMSSVDGNQYAMLHTDANGAVDLNTQIPANSGWVLTQIVGINASGQMVGDGKLNGVPMVFRLTPPSQKDTTPPVISKVTATPWSLPVVNGQMVSVTVAVSATDDDGKVPTCKLSSISGPGTAGVDFVVTGPLAGSVRAIGGRTYVFHVTCTDAAGNSSSGSTNVVVPLDTTPPVISKVTASPSSIWPPTNKMVAVAVSVKVTDNLDPSPSCVLTSISAGDGHDSAVTGRLTGMVRAEHRAVYVLTVTCSDFSGNKSTATTTVRVTRVNPPAVKHPKSSADRDRDDDL